MKVLQQGDERPISAAHYGALLELVARARQAATVKPLYCLFGELMASAATGMLAIAPAPLLPQVCTWWRTYCILAKWMIPIFRVVDPGYSADYMRLTARAWLLGEKSWTFLASVAARAFRSSCFQHVQNGFMEEILREAQRDRSGQLVDQMIIREAIKLARRMCSVEGALFLRTMADVYAAVDDSGCNQEFAVYFEEPFAAAMLNHYGALREAWLTEGVSAYLLRVEAALAAEDRRWRAYGLPAATIVRLANGCRVFFLASSALDIVRAMPAFLKAYYMHQSLEPDTQDLSRMYALFQGGGDEGGSTVCIKEGMEAMACALERFLKDLGQEAAVVRKQSEGKAMAGQLHQFAGFLRTVLLPFCRVSPDIRRTFKNGHGAHKAVGFWRVLQRHGDGQNVHGTRGGLYCFLLGRVMFDVPIVHREAWRP